MTTIREQVEAWPANPAYMLEHLSNAEPYKTNRILRAAMDDVRALEARLRTAGEVLKERADAVDWLFACFPALTEVLTAEQIASLGRGASDARAVLARLEKEGLV